MKDHGGGVDHYAKIIEKHLVEAGYGKVDPNLLAVLVDFRHGLGNLQENLRTIMHKTELLSLSDEKCTQLLNIINHHLRPR
ncbi:MAG: hypothetical protein HY889_10335 [Deltaproteobacteria bacterium]|nr:hypothetical protein [Deltaproteobacteria bacterium]